MSVVTLTPHHSLQSILRIALQNKAYVSLTLCLLLLYSAYFHFTQLNLLWLRPLLIHSLHFMAPPNSPVLCLILLWIRVDRMTFCSIELRNIERKYRAVGNKNAVFSHFITYWESHWNLQSRTYSINYGCYINVSPAHRSLSRHLEGTWRRETCLPLSSLHRRWEQSSMRQERLYRRCRRYELPPSTRLRPAATIDQDFMTAHSFIVISLDNNLPAWGIRWLCSSPPPLLSAVQLTHRCQPVLNRLPIRSPVWRDETVPSSAASLSSDSPASLRRSHRILSPYPCLLQNIRCCPAPIPEIAWDPT